METLINLKNVKFGYSETLFEGVSFEVLKGDVISIAGKAGVGKTSILKIASGLLMPDLGNVFIEGKDVWVLNDAKRTILRNNIAFYFQESALIANMTIFDNLALRFRYHNSYSETEIQKIINEMLGLFELEKYKTQLPASLTLDLKRKVALIRAITTFKPKLYFWDDIDDLDDDSLNIIEKVIKESQKLGIPSLMVSNSQKLIHLINKTYKIESSKLVTA